MLAQEKADMGMSDLQVAGLASPQIADGKKKRKEKKMSSAAKKFDRLAEKVTSIKEEVAEKGMGMSGHTGESVKSDMVVHNAEGDKNSVSHGGMKVGTISKGTMEDGKTPAWTATHATTGAKSDPKATHGEAVQALADAHASHLNKMYGQVGQDSQHSMGDVVHLGDDNGTTGTVIGMHPLDGQWQYQVKTGDEVSSVPEKSLNPKEVKKVDTDDDPDPKNKLQTPKPYTDILRDHNPEVKLQIPVRLVGGDEFSEAVVKMTK